MRELLVQIAHGTPARVMAIWIVLSVGVTAVLARIFQRLAGEHVAPSYDRGEPLGGDDDIVDATGGIEEAGAACRTSACWPEESLDALWTAAKDPDFIDSVMADIAMLDAASQSGFPLSDEVSDDGKKTK